MLENIKIKKMMRKVPTMVLQQQEGMRAHMAMTCQEYWREPGSANLTMPMESS